jgi:hypothetical protein
MKIATTRSKNSSLSRKMEAVTEELSCLPFQKLKYIIQRKLKEIRRRL